MSDELIYAVKAGKINEVKQVLQKNKDCADIINEPDGHGYTALGWAIKNNKPELLQLLLNYGANPDLGISLGQIYLDKTCLELALESNNLNLIKLLLNYGANPYLGKPSSDEYLLGQLIVPLHNALRQYSYDIIVILLNASPLVVAGDSNKLKMLLDYNSHLTPEQKLKLKTEIDKCASFLNMPAKAIIENPHEFIQFIKQIYFNTFHFNNILNCLAEALKTTKDVDIKDQLCNLIGKIGEHYHEKYVDSEAHDTASLVRAYEMWSKVILEDLEYYIALMKKSFTKINAKHFDILLENLKISPKLLEQHENKNQFLVLYGKIFHEKYLHSGNADVKSLATACLKWSEIGSPDTLAADDNLLLGELMHVAKQDSLLSLCYSLMDCYQREMSMLLHLGTAARIFENKPNDNPVSDNVILARRLLSGLIEPIIPFSAESDFNSKIFQDSYDKKMHELFLATTKLKEIGWYELNNSMREFMEFLIKNDKFSDSNDEYKFYQRVAALKLEAEIAADLTKRQEKVEELQSLVVNKLQLLIEEQKSAGFFKKIFSGSLEKKIIAILSDMQNKLNSIDTQLKKYHFNLGSTPSS